MAAAAAAAAAADPGPRFPRLDACRLVCIVGVFLFCGLTYVVPMAPTSGLPWTPTAFQRQPGSAGGYRIPANTDAVCHDFQTALEACEQACAEPGSRLQRCRTAVDGYFATLNEECGDIVQNLGKCSQAARTTGGEPSEFCGDFQKELVACTSAIPAPNLNLGS